ncbi:MAG: MFS transporter [Deltaproteobacteria bacterium]|nr:MFS transporter [Deltaproteobacteria bacterium]
MFATSQRIASLFVPDVRGLPAAFWLLLSATLIDRLGGFAHVYLALYLTGPAGVDVGTAGALISLLAVGGVLGSAVGGTLADRLGRKPLILAGMLLTAANYAVLSQLRALPAIAASLFVAGVANTLPRPAMAAAIADVVAAHDRRRAYSLQFWVINLAFAFAATVAGLLVKVAWSLVFLIDAATSLLAAGLLWAWMRDRHMPAPAVAVERPVARGPLYDKTFRSLFAVGLLTAAIYNQCNVALAAEMTVDGLVAAYGPLLAINGILIGLLQPFATRTTAAVAPVPLLAVGSLLIGTGFGLTALADTALAHGACIVTWTLGEILLSSTASAAVAGLAPADQRARYQGAWQSSWSAAALAPAAGAYVLAHAGSRVLWGGCAVLGLVGAAVVARLGRDPRLAADPTARA